MSDIVERAKNWIYPNYDDISPETGEIIRELIAEVEKLREIKYEATHEGMLLEASRSVCRELNEEIDSLTKERDELKLNYISDVEQLEHKVDGLKAKLAEKKKGERIKVWSSIEGRYI